MGRRSLFKKHAQHNISGPIVDRDSTDITELLKKFKDVRDAGSRNLYDPNIPKYQGYHPVSKPSVFKPYFGSFRRSRRSRNFGMMRPMRPQQLDPNNPHNILFLYNQLKTGGLYNEWIMHQHPQVQNFLINKIIEEMYKILCNHNKKFNVNNEMKSYHTSLQAYLASKFVFAKTDPKTAAISRKLWASTTSFKETLNKL